MAWARDIETGEPRYIGEINAEHRGSKCCCECPSCRLALIALNAAKDKVIKRPHFRHPEGAQGDECAVLAARAAALRLLAEEGVIDLPRRRMSATVEGLSGAHQEAWVEAPAQKVRVAEFEQSHLAAEVIVYQVTGPRCRACGQNSVGANIAGLMQTFPRGVPVAVN